MKTVKFEEGKPNKDGSNWLCPNCNNRPPAQMIMERDNRHYCIYCNYELIFNIKENNNANTIERRR